jgi:hypothetical protein
MEAQVTLAHKEMLATVVDALRGGCSAGGAAVSFEAKPSSPAHGKVTDLSAWSPRNVQSS